MEGVGEILPTGSGQDGHELLEGQEGRPELKLHLEISEVPHI